MQFGPVGVALTPAPSISSSLTRTVLSNPLHRSSTPASRWYVVWTTVSPSMPRTTVFTLVMIVLLWFITLRLLVHNLVSFLGPEPVAITAVLPLAETFSMKVLMVVVMYGSLTRQILSQRYLTSRRLFHAILTSAT